MEEGEDSVIDAQQWAADPRKWRLPVYGLFIQHCFYPTANNTLKSYFSYKFLCIFERIKMYLNNHITIKLREFSYNWQDSNLHWDSFKTSVWAECCKVQLHFISTHLKASYSTRAVERHHCENKNLVQVLSSLNSYFHYGQFSPLCQYK